MLTDSVSAPELYVSLDEADAMASSVSTGFYAWLVPFLIPLDCSQLLASNLINYGTRLELCFCLFHRQVKYELLRWFITFPVIQLHLGVQASLPPENISLNPANKRTHQGLSDWHWCICSCHFRHSSLFLLEELLWLIHIASLQGSNGGVHELPTKIHDILDNAGSKWNGKVAWILVYL